MNTSENQFVTTVLPKEDLASADCFSLKWLKAGIVVSDT